MPQDYARAAMFLAAVWALCALAHPAVRRALLEGARCVSRYPDFWRLPAIFGLGYAIFQFAAEAIFHWRTDDLVSWITRVEWQSQPAPMPLVISSLLPAAERTASVFTIFTATFPLSAIFALLLLFNFRGLLVEMARALCRRLGRTAGIPASALLLLAALAGLVNPAIYLLLPEISERAPFIAALGVNFLAAIFELTLGIFFLTYLMLMAYAWRRGLHFERPKLFRMAMRRSGFVVKWSLPLAMLATLLILVPLDLGILLAPGDDFYDASVWFSAVIGRPAAIAVALICCPVQAILVFHNESLPRALRESMRLLRDRWLAILPFLASAYCAFLLLETATGYATARLGAGTSPALGCLLITAWIEAMVAGWLIASWVCLYKSLSTSRKEIPF